MYQPQRQRVKKEPGVHNAAAPQAAAPQAAPAVEWSNRHVRLCDRLERVEPEADDDGRGRVKDAVVELIRLWQSPEEKLTAAMLAVRIRKQESEALNVTVLQEMVREKVPGERLKLGWILRHFPDIFLPHILSREDELRELVLARRIMCPKDRYPTLPLLCWQVDKGAFKDSYGALTHYSHFGGVHTHLR